MESDFQNYKVFQKRRSSLGSQRDQKFAMVLFSGVEGYIDRFRCSSHFYYFTGFNEPDCVVVLVGGGDSQVEYNLFLREKDPTKELWDGQRLGVERAPEMLKCDKSFSIAQLESELPGLLLGCSEVYYGLGDHPDDDSLVLEALKQTQQLQRRSGQGQLPLKDPLELIAPMRVKKSDFEIQNLREAARASIVGHRLAMGRVTPGMNEIQIYALLLSGFYGEKAHREGYSAIVASGDNATILHYRENRRTIQHGEFLLIDAGAEKNFYTADITRTFPVGGRFSPVQRDVYSAVLDVQKKLIAKASERNMNLIELQQWACRWITEKLIQLKLCKGSVDEILEKKEYLKYYPHGVGHFLGMDVHDVGFSKDSKGPVPFSSGMVITVEPGIYIPKNDDTVPHEFRGLGVRIEDDVLLQGEGQPPDVLTKDLIKEVAELENFVGSMGAPPHTLT